MRKRVGYLVIDGKQFGDVYRPLEITFDVTYMGNSLVPIDSHFSIDNLSKEDIYDITTNTQLFIDRKRHIEFWCGYEDNYQKIFDGQISTANPSGQPDTSVNITAWSSTYIMGTNVQIERKNTSYLELLKDAALRCGFDLAVPAVLANSPELRQVVDNFTHTGSTYDYLRRIISDITGFSLVKNQLLFYIQNGLITVSRDDFVNTGLPIIEINSSTGMIGVPQPHSVGIDLRTLLNVSLTAGQTVNIKSDLLPLYNGSYNIFSVTHHGSIRGNDFYTDLYCLKVGGGIL